MLFGSNTLFIELRAEIKPGNDFQDHSVDPKPRLGIILHVCFLGGKGEFESETA